MRENNYLRLLGAALLAVCGCTAVHAEDELKIYGSNTVGAELAPSLVKGWLVKKGYDQISTKREGTELFLTGTDKGGKQLVVELDAQGSSTGFRALTEKQADIGMSSRPIKSSEVTALAKYGHCDQAACEHVVALDGIAIIVNQKNPLSTLDTAQLKRIFTGEVDDWSQVGGRSGPVHVYALDSNSGTYDTFKSLVLGKGGSLVSGSKRDASHEAISAMVAKDPNGIGFVGLPFVNDSKALSVADGKARSIAPAPFSVATEDYVLARRLYFYLPEISASTLATEFVNFATSIEGQEIARQVGFISQNIIAGEVKHGSKEPKEYQTLTEGAKRLSLNFRFLPGTPKLDNKAQRDVARLKQYLKRPENKGRELMLFGFADSNESMPIVALQLSTERADVVADLLIRQGLRPRKVRGYGSAVPVASNATSAGRSKNRRVEVWLR